MPDALNVQAVPESFGNGLVWPATAVALGSDEAAGAKAPS